MHDSEGTFKNIRVYCAYLSFSLEFKATTDSSCNVGLAFIAYWGIVLFGYDTCDH